MNNSPNIILINCDDLGYGDLGCYGSGVHKTPYLDRMAEEGVRFTDFYMPASICSPSRGAMLTGCYPPRVGFGWFDNRWVLLPGHPVGLNPEEITIAQLLKEAGYSTKLVGKWHCGDQPPFLPTRHGFESFYGLPYSNDMGRQTNKKNYPPLPLMKGDEVIQQQPDQSSLTERYVEESVRFIRENRDGPFFLYFAHMYVHKPLFAPERFMKSSEDGRYGAAVECIDWAAGAILHELDDLGIADNTLVIFTSDNGSTRPESNAPLRGTKGTTWEGGMRAPCIMRWPGHIPQGGICEEIATAMDFYPTLAAIGGAETPDDRIIDGKNIQHLMQSDGSAKSPHAAFFYYKTNRLEAVRSGRWKLHVGKRTGRGTNKSLGGPRKKDMQELYDLKSDPAESRNLYHEKPEVVAELQALLDECREDIGDVATGVKGKNNRPIGRVKQAETLTHFDPDHPYIISEYDLNDLK